MTRAVVTISPHTSVPEIARVMIGKRISAVPVLDRGVLVGIVSEGDLVRRAEIGTEHRLSRWMELFFNRTLAADYIRAHGRKASDVMTRNVITVGPATSVSEIANIFERCDIKRVPVVENGVLVGIVSRADLIHALASTEKPELPMAPQDREIREAIYQQMQNQPWACSPIETNVIVHNGEVQLCGYIKSEEARRAMMVIAENIPGVRHVQDHMEYPPIRPAWP